MNVGTVHNVGRARKQIAPYGNDEAGKKRLVLDIG
jgi:hypothetical protein